MYILIVSMLRGNCITEYNVKVINNIHILTGLVIRLMANIICALECEDFFYQTVSEFICIEIIERNHAICK